MKVRCPKCKNNDEPYDISDEETFFSDDGDLLGIIYHGFICNECGYTFDVEYKMPNGIPWQIGDIYE